MHKVLIITYYWPPSGGAGVQRWLKFVKYLPQTGIEPVILTVDPQWASYPQKDYELAKDISPNLEIIYTKASTGIFTAYKKLTRKNEVPYGGFANESEPGLLQHILRFIRGNFFLPDARKGWNRFAFKAALEIIREKNINTVITTSPPHSTQLIGLKLKNAVKVKWIADLRDPWTEIYYEEKIFQTLPARCINRRMESRVLDNADIVIATCNTTRDVFRSRLSQGQSPGKIITITNGFDPDDFSNVPDIPEKFTITYLGTFAGNYEIDVLIKAIDNFHKSEKKVIHLRFIGKTDEKVIRKLKENVNISFELIPYVDHQKAMEYLAKSAALLLVVPSTKKSNEMIPGKLFEYLASKRPIIAIGPAVSDVASILEETGGGRIFDKQDFREMGEYLLEIHKNYANGLFESNPTATEPYSRINLAKRIADIVYTI